MKSKPPTSLKILACQVEVQGINSVHARKNNLARLAKLIEAANTRSSIDLVVMPELSTIEYSEAAFENLAELAEPLRGPSFTFFAQLAKKIDAAICYGFPRVEQGQYYISQQVIDRNGAYLCHYDKLHIAQFGASAEQPYFNAGDHSAVFNINGFRIGIIICYDIRFGDYISQLCRQQQLDVVLHPSAFYRDGSFASWHDFAKTRALENQVYFLSLNRSGENWGNSLFSPPWFEHAEMVKTMATAESLQEFVLSAENIRWARNTYPLARDRKSDYEILAARTADAPD